MTGATTTAGAPWLSTERLLLRGWQDADRDRFAALNADVEVMEHFVAPLTREESDAFVDRIEAGFATRPFGLWAVEVRDTGEFVGYIGLEIPKFEAFFTPAVEVGWRLARPAWGHGYATEGARAVLRHGFETVGLDEIVSFTSVHNVRSQRVMQRLGMERAGEFDHPNVPPDHRINRHVVYRLARATWRGRDAG